MSSLQVSPSLLPSQQPVIDMPPHGYVRLVSVHGTDLDIVKAARVSFGGTLKGEEADKKLLMFLYRNRHTSPFEQVSLTFNIKFPIFLMRQFVRHRTFRLNEISARYKELPEEYFTPGAWRYQGDNANKQVSGDPIPHSGTLTRLVEKTYRDCHDTYKMLLTEGVSREQARMVLPVGIYTEIVVNCDLHNLLHFLRLRLDPHAQPEIQEVAVAMQTFARAAFPWTLEAFSRYQTHVVDTYDGPEVKE